MAEKKRKKVPGTCIFCSNFCEKGWDKNDRAYIMCKFCGATLFLGTALAEAGHSILHGIVSSNLKSYKEELEKRLIEIRMTGSKGNRTVELDHTLESLGVKMNKL